MVEKLREDGGIGWWEEYEVLRRKIKLDNEGGLVGKLKNKIKVKNEKDREEEAYTKSTLKWYRLAKDDTGVAVAVQAEDWFTQVVGEYVRSVQGQESV